MRLDPNALQMAVSNTEQELAMGAAFSLGLPASSGRLSFATVCDRSEAKSTAGRAEAADSFWHCKSD